MEKYLKLEPGTKLYALATGRISVFRKASREAASLVSKQPGFVAVYPDAEHSATLWYFDSENAAKRARNVCQAQGIQFGANVSRWIVAADGVPEFDQSQLPKAPKAGE